MSIKRQILLWMLVITLIPLAILTFQGLHCAYMAIKDLQAQRLRSVLTLRRQQIEDWMAKWLRVIQFLETSPELQAVLRNSENQTARKAAVNLLDRVQCENVYFQSLAVFDENWQPLAETAGYASSANKPLIPELKKRLGAGEKLVLGPPKAQPDGQIRIFLARLLKLDDTIKGYLSIKLELNDTLVLSGKSYDLPRLYLVAADGRYLVLPTAGKRFAGTFSSLPKSLLAGDNRLVEYRNYEDTPVLGQAVRVERLGWIIVAETDKATAFEWAYELGRRALITAGGALFLILFLAFRVSGRLSRPLQALARVARKVAQGDTAQRLEKFGDTESREVAMAFNHMLDQLAETHKRLVQTASLAAVGELSASIVHEMRTPLATIKMNLDALQKKMDQDKAYIELGQLAEKQVERLETMLNDLLGYGKPIVLKLQTVDAIHLVRETVKLVTESADKKQLELQFPEPEGQFTVTADPEQLRRVLINLLNNAIQATPEQGTIEIGLSNGDEVQFTVTDHGPGITEDAREKLFKPFFTTRSDGTGLGLAIVKKIVDLHGGSIRVHNRKGAGAVFTLQIPGAK